MKKDLIEQFVKVYQPLYFTDCDAKHSEYRVYAKEKMGVMINHPVEIKDEDTICQFLEKRKQDILTIKWKLGVPLDVDTDIVKTRYHKFPQEKLNIFCEKTNKGAYDFETEEGIRGAFNDLSKKVDELELTGYGSVYLISSLFFLSGGHIPIYDYYAHVAVKALLYDVNPQDVFVAGAPGRNEYSRGDKNKNSAVNLLFEYKRLLHNLFNGTEFYDQNGMLISRELDQALWVYGHATEKCSDSILKDAIKKIKRF
jgi:hypothetical protein